MSAQQIITVFGVIVLAYFVNSNVACTSKAKDEYCLGTDGIGDVSSEAGEGEWFAPTPQSLKVY